MEADILHSAEQLRTAVGAFVRAARVHEELPATQLAVLGHLDRAGPATISTLAAVCGIRHQSATKVVAVLQAAAAVVIAPHPSDRRAVEVAIAPHGRELLNSERLRRSVWIARAIAEHLSPEDYGQVQRAADLLARLTMAEDH